MAQTTNNPSPEEIAERCLAIQAEWTPAERLKRLRCDLRPAYRACDGSMEEMTADVYDDHHSGRDELLDGRVTPQGF